MIDNIPQLVEAIQSEAHRLAGDGGDLRAAYTEAITNVLMRLAEGQAVDPFEARILVELEQAARDTGGKPVPTTAIAVRVGVASRFTMYAYLRNLERRGLVHRPFGRKSKAGWRVAA